MYSSSNHKFSCFRVRRNRRRGTAAVEAAACFPLIVMLVLASVELSAGYFHQHTLRATAHECAKLTAREGTTTSDVQSLATQLLGQRKMGVGYTVNIDTVTRTVNMGSVDPPTGPTSFTFSDSGTPPPGLEEMPRGTLLRLRISAIRPAIAGVGVVRYLSPNMSAECFFVKEI